MKNDFYNELKDVTTPKEAESLARVADVLTRVAQPVRSKQTHRASRKALMARIHAEDASHGSWLRNWKLALVPAGAVAVVVGLVFFSQSAIPGDRLYTLKRQFEDFQLVATVSAAKKANLCSVQMKTRANELSRLPQDRMSDASVTNLTSAILEEAREFKEYQQQSGSQQTKLEEQRLRDINYVLEALNKANDHTDSQSQKETLNKAISELQDSLTA